MKYSPLSKRVGREKLSSTSWREVVAHFWQWIDYYPLLPLSCHLTGSADIFSVKCLAAPFLPHPWSQFRAFGISMVDCCDSFPTDFLIWIPHSPTLQSFPHCATKVIFLVFHFQYLPFLLNTASSLDSSLNFRSSLWCAPCLQPYFLPLIRVSFAPLLSHAPVDFSHFSSFIPILYFPSIFEKFTYLSSLRSKSQTLGRLPQLHVAFCNLVQR